MRRLALQELLESQPGVLRVELERDRRGAVIQIQATVATSSAGEALRRLVADKVGARFADERLHLTVPESGERLRLLEVASSLRSGRAAVEVAVQGDGRRISASREGPSFPGSPMRLAADAALEAIMKGAGRTGEARLTDLTVTEVGREQVVVVAVELTFASRQEKVHGAAGIGDGAPEAASARAVLNAVNRVLTPRPTRRSAPLPPGEAPPLGVPEES